MPGPKKIVRTPFAHLTVSIDGGTPETYASLRRGADLNAVLANIERVQNWKSKLGSQLPYMSSFFVVMRSTFREIPLYLEHVRRLGIAEVTLEILQINNNNTAREPDLVNDEEIATDEEVAELHGLLRHTLECERVNFRMIRFSGVTALFERYGLDAAFLEERANGLYPDSDQLAPRDGSTGFDLCPNPWTTLFITEYGDVHICFLAEPIGNLYETPLAALWNCPRALTMRRRMLQGRYADSGCTISHCSWREGMASSEPEPLGAAELATELRDLSVGRSAPFKLNDADELPDGLGAVRRMLNSANRRVAELESVCNAGFEGEVLWLQKEYDGLLQAGERHIGHLETKREKAISDFHVIEGEFARYRSSPLVRMAHKVSGILKREAKRE
jgi:MoaA/NifB/PqqE/SkfB family radical SAM enzyme